MRHLIAFVISLLLCVSAASADKKFRPSLGDYSGRVWLKSYTNNIGGINAVPMLQRSFYLRNAGKTLNIFDKATKEWWYAGKVNSKVWQYTKSGNFMLQQDICLVFRDSFFSFPSAIKMDYAELLTITCGRPGVVDGYTSMSWSGTLKLKAAKK